ncbi:MAG: NADH-quinone oxidoreductase subunit NuoE [Flavobacteriales bacterium]
MSHTSQPVFDPNEVVAFSDAMLQQMNEVVKNFPKDKEKSALLRILHIAQAEYGWVSVPVMNKIAEFLEIQAIEVYEVATFYTMFHLQPVGKHVFEVCRTGPCMLVGSDQLIDHLEKKLDIKVGETTSDGMFTLKTAECLGGCGYGPLLQCRNKYHEHLSIEKVDALIEQYRNGEIL